MGQRLFRHVLWKAQDLDSGASIVSGVIDCRNADPEYLMLKVTAAGGTASVKVEVAISTDGSTFNSFTSQEAIDSATATTYASLNPEEYHSLLVPGAPWIKLRLTDVASLTTVVDADLWMRES